MGRVLPTWDDVDYRGLGVVEQSLVVFTGP
jgi:hypothetical protein